MMTSVALEAAEEAFHLHISKEILIHSKHSVHSSKEMAGVSTIMTTKTIYFLIIIYLGDSKASEADLIVDLAGHLNSIMI
jgi:hypothetical protein